MASIDTQPPPPVTLDQRYALNPLFLLRWEASQDAYVLLYPEGVVKLNQTAAAILRRCTGEWTVDQAIDQLTDEFNQTDRQLIAGSVLKFVEASRDKGWIRIND